MIKLENLSPENQILFDELVEGYLLECALTIEGNRIRTDYHRKTRRRNRRSK